LLPRGLDAHHLREAHAVRDDAVDEGVLILERWERDDDVRKLAAAPARVTSAPSASMNGTTVVPPTIQTTAPGLMAAAFLTTCRARSA
jgi:hypothetical protein